MWKLLAAIVLNFAIFTLGPLIFCSMGLMEPITEKAWIVLIVTAIGLSTKTIFGDLVSGHFTFGKHGYDFCLTAMGASMSSLCLQILTSKNLFPGVPNVPFGGTLASAISDPVHLSIGFLFVIFVLSSFGTLLTAHICKSLAVEGKQPNYPDALSAINYAVGTGLLGFYILLLITKG